MGGVRGGGGGEDASGCVCICAGCLLAALCCGAPFVRGKCTFSGSSLFLMKHVIASHNETEGVVSIPWAIIMCRNKYRP